MRYARNTLAVLLVTAATAVSVYAGIQLLSKSVNPSDAAAAVATAGQTYVCPKTGCSATTCHATQGQSAGASRGAGGSTAATATAGAGSVCPATGCSATTCHGATGSPPPSRGGRVDGASGGTLTCPRTGCSASSCHATDGTRPGSGASGYGSGRGSGHGRGRGGGHSESYGDGSYGGYY